MNNIILSETRSSQYAQKIEFIKVIDMRGILYGDYILPGMAFCSRASVFTFLVGSVGYVEDLLFCFFGANEDLRWPACPKTRTHGVRFRNKRVARLEVLLHYVIGIGYFLFIVALGNHVPDNY